MEDYLDDNDNLDPVRSLARAKGTSPEDLGEATSNGMEATLASTKKEPRQEGEGQLTIDVFQTEDDVVIQSTIAGVSDKDLDISVTNDMVTIKGTRAPEQKIRHSDYYYQELYWGPFSRSIILPVDVDADNAKASMKNGVLTIRLPKLDRIRTKKIRVS